MSESCAAFEDVAIQYSVFQGQALKQILMTAYGLTEVRCKLLHHGFNDSYSVSSEEGEFIFRVYRYSWRTYEEILAEVNYLFFLKNHGLDVSIPVKGVDGISLIAIKAPEGVRYGVLFDKAQGNIPLTLSNELCGKLGKILGQMHNLSDSWEERVDRPVLDSKFLIVESLGTLRDTFSHRLEQLDALTRAFDSIINRVDRIDHQPPAFGLIHGDYLKVNVFTREDDRFTLFDFDFCGYGFRLYDLATFKWSLCMTQKDQVDELFSSFISHYGDETALDKHALEMIDDFVAVRHLWVWGLNVRTEDDFRLFNDHSFNYRYEILMKFLDQVS